MAFRRAKLSAVVPALLVTAALAGCDAPGFKKAAKAPLAPAPIGQTTTTSAGVGPGASSLIQAPAVFTPGLTVSDVIARACGIAPRNAQGVTPSFDYDSAAIAEADRVVLAEVAKCLTEGALRGKTVALVGRADARGEPEYNMTLGESRANTVSRYLVDLGVGKDRLRSTSRGEIDATGTNEEGYARDRRVDIELLP